MKPIKQALIDTEYQICNLLDILDHDGNLEKFEQELDNISQTFDDWTDRVNEELKRQEVREYIIRKEVSNFIKKFETRMEDLGYATLESRKTLRDELDNRIEQDIKRMIGDKK